mmetsp:Transcript_108417/g.288559  ORF Transcript_108417/g.288559 Transcript_108417/m.288559 type:complete len:262 (-) Transcript_108417:137-922(-)
MANGPCHVVLGCDLPHLLDAEPVVLRADALPEVEARHDVLAEGPPAALGEDGLLAQELHAGLEGVLALPVLADAHVPELDAAHGAVLSDDGLAGCEARVDLHAELLRLLPEPAAELPEGDHVVAMLAERRRQVDQEARNFHGALPVWQPVEGVAHDRSVEGGAPLLPVRKELVERARLEDVPRQDVGADLRALLNDAHVQLLALRACYLLCSDCCTEACRASAHDDNVKLHLLALDRLAAEPAAPGLPLIRRCAQAGWRPS